MARGPLNIVVDNGGLAEKKSWDSKQQWLLIIRIGTERQYKRQKTQCLSNNTQKTLAMHFAHCFSHLS